MTCSAFLATALYIIMVYPVFLTEEGKIKLIILSSGILNPYSSSV